MFLLVCFQKNLTTSASDRSRRKDILISYRQGLNYFDVSSCPRRLQKYVGSHVNPCKNDPIQPLALYVSSEIAQISGLGPMLKIL